MREVEFSREAQADLMERWAHFYRRSVRAAVRFSDLCTEKFDLLCEFPNLGRARPEFVGKLRSLPVENHIIFYRVTDTKIFIARVVHGATDLTQIFEPAENDTP